MFQIQREITAADVEPEYNHVHHARSLRWLEEARLEYLKACGVPNEGFMQQGLFLVITNISVRYRRELKSGSIYISCEEPRIEGKAVILNQRIWNSKQKVAIEACVESQFLSAELQKAVLPPAGFVERFKAI